MALEGQRPGVPFCAAVQTRVVANAQVHPRSTAHAMAAEMVGSDRMSMAELDVAMPGHRMVVQVAMRHQHHHTVAAGGHVAADHATPCRALQHASMLGRESPCIRSRFACVAH